MKTLLLAAATATLFAGVFAPQASAYDHHRYKHCRSERVVIYERPYYYHPRYVTYYDEPYYENYRPFYRTSYHRYYSRPRFTFALGF
ncbi:MAG: hypothetical protein QOD99_2210 [Chthoniobacter sp.]|jgi:hypothetical protein|nr:hypothetical protein [Chthoniobacter sp.]